MVATNVFRGSRRANLVGQIQGMLFRGVLSRLGAVEEVADQAEVERALELKKRGITF
jgi:hypothetical protein